MTAIPLVLRALLAALALLPGTALACSAGAGVAMHVPVSRAERAPLVLVLHGSTSRGEEALRDSGLVATADRHGFVLVAPDAGLRAGNGFAWNIPGVPTVTGALPGRGDRDDVAYLLSLVDRLVGERCVDPARVYVTGLSGGGRMASLMGCVAARRIAAIAPVVGLRAGRPRRDGSSAPDPASCRPAMPVPVLAFAGDADRTNPIAGGGAPYWQYPMDAALRRWASLDGCTAPVPARWVTPTVYEQRYPACRNGSEVIARVTVGGGHSFAVADNEAMWRFFSRHVRR